MLTDTARAQELADRLDSLGPGDELAAARLHVEYEHFLERPSLGDNARQVVRGADDELLSRFPDAKHRAAVSTAEDLGGLSPAEKRTHQAVRKRYGMSAGDAARERSNLRRRGEHPAAGSDRAARPPARRGTGGTSAGRRHATRSRGGGSAGGGLLDGAGDLLFSGGWGQLLMQAMVGTVGLVIVYTLVRRPQGAELIAKTIRTSVDTLVRPTDPLARFAGGRGGGVAPIKQGPLDATSLAQKLNDKYAPTAATKTP